MTRVLLASIHDVSPRFESEIDALIETLSAHVGHHMAMLVVPNHWGDAPIVPGSAFATKLRRWADAGFEMFVHGYYHRDDASHTGADRLRARWMTAGEGEFLGLPKAEAVVRIEHGRALIEGVTGRSIAGFVAPAWLYGEGTREALARCSIPIAESHWRVWAPTTGAELARGPVITWASRTRLRLASSLAAARALRGSRTRVLRIGLHPPDCRHPAVIRSVGAALRHSIAHREVARYGDLTVALPGTASAAA
jgi:predicted deacetylase